MRGIIDKYPDDWEMCLPFAVGALRGSEMAVLGGRSPFEVVTGMKPTMPATLKAQLPVGGIGVDDYVRGLVECLQETYTSVQEAQKEIQERREKQAPGRMSAQLRIGDIVLLRNRDHEMPRGEHRWNQKTDGVLYRISEAMGQNTFRLAGVRTGGPPVSSGGGANPINKFGAERLVRVELPETETRLRYPHRIEVWDADVGDWQVATVEQVAVDGAMLLRYDHDLSNPEWVDLSKERFRWVR